MRNSNDHDSVSSANINISSVNDIYGNKPLAIVDHNGIIEFCNSNFEFSFKLTQGESIDDFDSDPYILPILTNLSKNFISRFQFELNYITPEVDKAYDVNIENIKLEGKELFLISFNALSEINVIENRINNLHNAIEYGGVPVLITNKNGLVNYTSISFEKILRKRLEEIYNVYLPDILQKYLTKTEYEELDDAIKKGREWVKIISFVSENSGIKIREVKLNPIYRNSTFSKNFILTANDITNYILKNKIIKKSEERQRTIINNISDPLIIIRQEESQFYVENVNDSFIKTFEKAKDTIIEKSMYQVFPKSLQDIISESIYEIEVGKIAKVKFRYKHELSEKVFAGKLTYVDNSYDKFRIYIITLSDITERLNHEEKLKKALEKENQLNKLKTSFLTNMSHEIRTPLNAISGYSTLLEEDIKDGFYDSVTELAGALKEGVERLLGLVDNIVEASLLESGTDSYSFKDICLNDLLFKIYNDFKKKEYPKNLDFYFESEKEELYLNADESKLEKIISLILDNSTKYNVEKGQIFIRLRSTAKSIFIEIEDTGIGIEENKIKQILEPFSQAEDDGYTRRHEGAGLGLTIAYKLTKEFKGDLDINSRVGEGTTIILRFPKVTLS